MTFVFLAILAMAWMFVFLPAVLRATQQTPLRSAESFRRGMQVIAPGYERALEQQRAVQQRAFHDRSRPRRQAAPVPARPSPRRVAAARQRIRRQVLAAMLTLAAWSGIAALFLGGAAWELHLLVDACLGLYVLFLADERRRRVERATKVRSIRPRASRPDNEIKLFETWAAAEEG